MGAQGRARGAKGEPRGTAMEAIVWQEETLGAKFTYEEIPSQMIEEANKYKEKLIETIVELDDDIMEK